MRMSPSDVLAEIVFFKGIMSMLMKSDGRFSEHLPVFVNHNIHV